MGGTVRYQYIRFDSLENLAIYRLTIIIYRNCNDPVPLDQALGLGIYNNDATRTINRPKTLTRTAIRNIPVSNGGANCTFTSNVCVQEGTYTDTIMLRPSALGFHVFYERCCRASNIQSLTANNGQGYYIYIPPTDIVNNSALFNDLPVPYICTNDTMITSSGATDSDGDSLVYRMVRPYSGGTSTNPAPGAQLSFPTFPLVQYQLGFNVNQPFGAGGFASINTQTGVLNYLVPAPGSYVIAIEVTEYRNGQIVGISRIDRELVVLPCPPNPNPSAGTMPPNLPFSTGPRSFRVPAGSNFQFPIAFTDPTDSIYISFEGELVQGQTVLAPRPIVPLAAGVGTVSTTFTWNTACYHPRATPYTLVVRARDNGCPPKTLIEVYNIEIFDPRTIRNLRGDTVVCPEIPYLYTFEGDSTHNYTWQITNGTLISTPTPNSALIRWHYNRTSGQIRLIETVPSGGCRDTLILPVVINSAEKPNAGLDRRVCVGDSIIIGANALSGYNYQWLPAINLNDSQRANPTFFAFNNALADSTYTYIVEATSPGGCVTKDTIVLTVTPFIDMTIANNFEICSGDTLVINPAFSPLFQFSWNIGSLFSISTDSSAIAISGFTSNSTTTIPITFETMLVAAPRCRRIVQSNVIVKPLPLPRAGINGRICQGDTLKLGLPTMPNYQYLWQPALYLNAINIAEPSFTYPFSIQNDTILQYSLTTTLSGCVNNDSVLVTVNPLPDTVILQGNLNPCANTISTYYIQNFSSGNYNWQISGGNLVSFAQDSLRILWHNPGLGQVTAQFINNNGCKSALSRLNVNINKPIVDTIIGRRNVCPGSNNNIYRVVRQTGVNYIWVVQGGIINGASNLDSVLVNWINPGVGSVKVVGTNQFGCISDTLSIEINITTNLNTPIPTGPNQVCEFSPGVIYAVAPNNNSSYTWEVTGGVIISGQGTNQIVVDWGIRSPNGRVRLTEISSVGCLYRPANVQVTINPRPQQPAILVVDSICLNRLPVLANALNTANDSVIQYAWSVNNNGAFNLISFDQINLNLNTPGNYTITVVPTNLFGCTGLEGSKIIRVLPLPVVQFTTNRNICSGDTINIGLPPINNVMYQWSPSNLVLSPNSSTTLFTYRNLSGVDTVVSAALSLTSSITGCTNADTLAITIRPQPITDAGPNRMVCASDTIILGTPSMPNQTYTWLPLVNLNNNTIAQPTFFSGHISETPISFTYILRVFNSQTQCTWRDTTIVTLNPIPILPNGLFYSVCSENEIEIGGVNNPLYNYRLEDSLGNIKGNGPLPFTVSFFNESRQDTIIGYRIFVNHVNSLINCEKNMPVYMQIRPRPQSDAGPDQLFCTGDTIELGTQPDTAFSYTWFGGPGIQNKFISNPKFTELNNGRNQLVQRLIVRTVFNKYQCDKLDTAFVTIAPLPFIDSIFGPALTCENQSMAYEVIPNRPNSIFDWKATNAQFIGDSTLNPVNLRWQAGLQNLVVVETDSNQCVSKPTSLAVRVLPKLDIGSIIGPLIVCKAPNNVANYRYSPQANFESLVWMVENGQIQGPNNQVDVQILWNEQGNCKLKLLVTNQNGCTSDTLIIPITMDIIDLQLASVGTLENNPNTWVFRIGNINQSINRTNFRLIGTADTLAQSSILSVNSIQTQAVSIKLADSLTQKPWFANIEAFDNCQVLQKGLWHSPVVLSGDINFDVLKLKWTSYLGWHADVAYELYDWSSESPVLVGRFFRNNFDDFLPNLTQNKWCFRIKAINTQDENIYSWSNIFCKELEPFCFIPNAFTPNKDGKNELFKPVCGRFSNYTFIIYNRLGQKVFETNNPDEGWNGQFKGITQKQGAYIYYIRYTGTGGNAGEFKGIFSLLSE